MRKILFLTAAACALLAGAAHAQEALRPGSVVDGELRKDDSRLTGGEFMDTYQFSGNAGDEISLRMSSPDFDTYLIVNGPGDFRDENDDGADGDTSAALTLRLPATGVYSVGATSYAANALGRYSLDFRTGAQSAAFAPQPAAAGAPGAALLAGQTVRGALQRGDGALSSGEFADVFPLQVRSGQTYTITLDSTDFDAYLMVRGPGGLSEDNDDDPERRGSTDSRLTFTALADGEASIHATSYEVGETGAYTLTLEQKGLAAPALPPAAAAAAAGGLIAVGETREGALGPGSRQLSSGEYIDTFTFNGRAGQQLDLSMISTEFDPFIQVQGPDGFSAFNDDDTASGGTDSRLLVTLPADGAYEIFATSYEGGETGRYRFAVRAGSGYAPPVAPVPAPAVSAVARDGGAIAIGDTVEGVLQSGDETLASGEFVDTFSFAGTRGQRVAVELTSSAFDAYIMLTEPSGEQIDNDDGEDGTNSLLDTALSETGEYTVSVTSYSPGETGSYRLSVAPSAGSPRQASVQGGARVFAVMVGVSEYGGYASDLPYTDEDAEKLAETLARAGVLNPASVTLTNADATVASVREAFRRVAAQAGPDDMFLFFFSGHGGQTETDAADISPAEPDGRGESIVLRDGELTDVEMAQMFDSLPTRLSLLVIDSCFSGGFARNVVDEPGVMGLFSSEEDLTSAVAGKFEAGGYLAHFLRSGLSGAADGDGDAMVTAGELSTYLRRQFTMEVEGVEAETQEGQRNYQNLVIDRGGVQIDDVVLRLAPAASVASLENAKGL